MTLEKRRPTNGIPLQRWNWRAISSPRTLESAYEDSGRSSCCSSIGAYSGGWSNGSPSVVSLDAHTTRPRPSCAAAANTVCVLVMFVRNTRSGVACTGEGIAARWTTASIPGRRSPPLSASSAWPYSVRSAIRNGAGESGELESPDGTTSMLSTSWPCSSRSLTTARPALPLPPVTAIFVIRRILSFAARDEHEAGVDGERRAVEVAVALGLGKAGAGEHRHQLARGVQPHRERPRVAV